MRLSPASLSGVFGWAFALGVLGCSKERPENAKPAIVAPDAVPAAAPSASAGGDEPERLCGAKSLCPGEVMDPESTMLCASLAREPVCGAKFLALVKCQIAQEKCGADGKTDQMATLDLCKVEESALHDCDQAKAAAAQASAK